MSTHLSSTVLIDQYIEVSAEHGETLKLVTDYKSLNIKAIHEFVDRCPEEWFTTAPVYINDKIERVSVGSYNNMNYWDIIMFINKKDPYSLLPVGNDTIIAYAEHKLATYQERVIIGELDQNTKERLLQTFIDEYIADNDERFSIKIIHPLYMQVFLQTAYEEGVF